jgi:hypothetical protein
MNGRQERLIRKAEKHLASGNPIPLDLAAQLMDAGIDVGLLERRYDMFAHI